MNVFKLYLTSMGAGGGGGERSWEPGNKKGMKLFEEGEMRARNAALPRWRDLVEIGKK